MSRRAYRKSRSVREKETFLCDFSNIFSILFLVLNFQSVFWVWDFLILFRFSQFSRFFSCFCIFDFSVSFCVFFFAPLYRILYDISQRQQKYFFLILILDEDNHSHPFRYSLTLNPFQFVCAANHVGMDMALNFLSMFGTERWRILGNGERHGCNVLSKHCHEDTCLHGRQHRDWYHRW